MGRPVCKGRQPGDKAGRSVASLTTGAVPGTEQSELGDGSKVQPTVQITRQACGHETGITLENFHHRGHPSFFTLIV